MRGRKKSKEKDPKDEKGLVNNSNQPVSYIAEMPAEQDGGVERTGSSRSSFKSISSDTLHFVKDETNHHTFIPVELRKVIKCTHCNWLIWGYMASPLRCAGLILFKN